MHEKTKDIGLVLASASEKYTDAIKFRAAVQLIPYLGSSLDTLLSGKGAEIQRRRIEAFIQDLDQRLRSIENPPPFEPSEELFDFMLSTFDSVVRSRSQQKIRRLSTLVAHQVAQRVAWDDAEAALRLLSQLEDLHIEVLLAVISAPELPESIGQRMATHLEVPKGEDLKTKTTPLVIRFSSYKPTALRLICAELLSKGLLHDDGIGRWGGRSMQMFAPTELAHWFINWIKETGVELTN